MLGLSVWHATIGRVVRRENTLVDQIEADALDENASLAGALRKCVILGGKAGSEQLRDWATRELEGYYGEGVELPDYRVVAGQIQVDAAVSNGLVSQQPIPPSSLPDFVREKVSEKCELRGGVGEIEALAQGAESSGQSVKLSLPMGTDIARVMNFEANNPSQQILSVYWALATPAVRGVIDQIRTALTKLVAELRATTPADQDIPSTAAANEAIHVVVTGKRNKINLTSSQASGLGATASTTVAGPEPESGFWTTSRRIGATIVGLAGVAGAIFAGIQVL